MRRAGATGKLATVGYLTARLDCSRQTALTLSRDRSFPLPIDILGDERQMAVWWRKDVDKWIDEHPDAVDAKAQARARERRSRPPAE